MNRIPNDFLKGKLTATTKVVELGGQPLPARATLNSTAAGNKIDVSPDGVVWLDVVLDNATPTAKSLRITEPVMFVRFTGAIGDNWSVV